MPLSEIYKEEIHCSRVESLTNALQKVAVVVEALLTVTLVARHRVLAASLLTDFFSKQKTFIDIWNTTHKYEFITLLKPLDIHWFDNNL